MTVSDLAKALRVQQGLMSMFELGQKSVSTYNLFKLSTVLDEPIENFFYGSERISPDSDHRKTLIDKVNILVKNLPDDKIKFIINTLKELSKLNFGKLK